MDSMSTSGETKPTFLYCHNGKAMLVDSGFTTDTYNVHRNRVNSGTVTPFGVRHNKSHNNSTKHDSSLLKRFVQNTILFSVFNLMWFNHL